MKKFFYDSAQGKFKPPTPAQLRRNRILLAIALVVIIILLLINNYPV